MNKQSNNQYFSYLSKTVNNDTSYYKQFDIVSIHDKDTILDLGCGPGMLLKYLKKKQLKGLKLFGCDTNSVAIKKNRNNKILKGIKFDSIGIDERLPYKDKTFDKIYCLDVIEHTKRPIYMLKEIKRVLKKDGVLVLNTPDRLAIILSPFFYGNIINFLPFNIKRLFGKAFLEYTHVKEYSYKELKGMLTSNGFYIKIQNKPTFLYYLPLLHRGSLLFALEKKHVNK